LEQYVVRYSASERSRCPPLSDSRCPFSPPEPASHGGVTQMTVRFEQDHGVGTIVLANPPSNRISSQFAVDLRAAVHDASLSDSRVLVIRSDGPNFCMGGNVPEWPRKSADWFRTFIAECNNSFHAIEALRIPTVAVVRGGAIGGGFELALACDFLVAAEDATFFAVEIRSGNIPLAGGLQRLAESVGRARAAHLALSAEPSSSSITGANSASRQLSAALVAALKATIPGLEVIRRDLDANPIPHLDSKRLPTVRPANAPEGAVGIADEGGSDVLDEFLSADILVIGAPMYNFGIPSQLKAWMRPHRDRRQNLQLHGGWANR